MNAWIYFIVAILILIFIIVIRALLNKSTSARDAVIDYTDYERADKYAEKLAKMIACETISEVGKEDKEKFYRFHEVLKELFPHVFNDCKIIDFDGSLLIKLEGKSSDRPIMLMSHQDVVAATGEWKYGPFDAEIVDRVIYGRGTVDTKASLFCIFQSFEELIAEGFIPECDVYIGSSCTEEISGIGAPTTANYLKNEGIKLKFLIDEGGMIIKDPIQTKGIYAMVGMLEKGYGDIKFTARTNGGHASAPGKDTALVRVARFISQVDKKYPFKAEMYPLLKEMFLRLSANMSFAMKLLFSNMWLFSAPLKLIMLNNNNSAAMLRTTVAFTTTKGSEGLNVLPEEAYVTANMRFIQHQGADESIEIISNIASKYDMETEVLYKEYPFKPVDYKGESFKYVESMIEKTFPDIGIIPYPMTGGTDARYYGEVCDNCIRFAPLFITEEQLDSIHGIDENINIDVLPKGVDFYKGIIENNK